MQKVLKCRGCGNILGRLEKEEVSWSDCVFILYVFRVRISPLWSSFEILCENCHEWTQLTESNLVEQIPQFSDRAHEIIEIGGR